MSKITFECPDDILQTLGETPGHFAEKRTSADSCQTCLNSEVYLLGKAARFAGMERVVFLDALKTYKYRRSIYPQKNWQRISSMPRICSVDTSPLLYFYRMDQLTLDSRPVSGHGVTFLCGNDEKNNVRK